ncbi:MAG: ATP-binding protein [Bdellovibrionales bacterium]
MKDEINTLRKKIERERKARENAEKLLEEKSVELYRLNSELMNTNANLEEQVFSRTSDLQKALLDAEKANTAKGQFLANMSHEIRTPLNGVIGFIDLLRKTDLNLDQKTFLDNIDYSGKLLLSIIEDVLEFSKIEEGKLSISEAEMNLDTCVFEILSGLSNEIYKKNLNLSVFIDECFTKNIVSDEGRIRQVLVNLIGNAMKFTPRGYISVKVLPIYTSSGTKAIIRVLDSGVGIPKKKQNSVFETFSQADVSDTRKYGGSGLGLSICKSIAEAMGGRLKLRSREGVGTIFDFIVPFEFAAKSSLEEKKNDFSSDYDRAYVYFDSRKMASNTLRRFKSWGVRGIADDKSGLFFKLPNNKNDKSIFIIDSNICTGNEIKELLLKNIHKKIILYCSPEELGNLQNTFEGKLEVLAKPISRTKLLDALREKNKTIAVENQGDLVGKKLRLLVAEDNLMNQQLMEAVLSDFGFDYRIVPNGVEAVSAFKEDRFDLILMDCQMPEMDGFEAVKLIRNSDKDKENPIPILAMTANAFRTTKENCFEVGMDAFITKPIKPMDLLKEIQKSTKPT